jgi:hypothetical protein
MEKGKTDKDKALAPAESSFLFYTTEDGKTRIQVKMQDETVWLTQAHLCELFDKDKRTISEHIRNIFSEGELHEESVVRNFRITAADGKSYNTNFYNQKLYLVRETKSTLDRDKRRETENKKVDCGKAHFKSLGVNFKDAKTINEVLQP